MEEINNFIECVEDMIDEIKYNIETIENNYPKLNNETIDPIYNSNNFKQYLENCGLLNKDIEDSINLYLRYFNK